MANTPTSDDHRRMANVAVQFLLRSQMTGADADNYIAVRNWLVMIANGNLEVRAPTSIGAHEIPAPSDTQ